MVVIGISIPMNHHIAMAKPVNSPDPCSKLKQINQFHKNRRSSSPPNIPTCDQSRFAIVDVIILIAVISASGFLIYPYAKIVTFAALELSKEVFDVLIEEISTAPLLFGCLGLSILFSVTALAALIVFSDRRCGKPGCRGLSDAAEFDIQLGTEDCVRKSSSNLSKNGLFELRRDHHRDLEAELKKMAPPNGRAVMIFRASCGCPIGRMEVPGPRKSRKVKK
ncbi:uncharacterized protein At5g19025-like [Andrographis paniculata]|uniref:uncharacterized protein At5g19025-like n=1 Tax=Andrographis paniculata TaxID=175694 RepID=UPI0021E74491|nr:uncharacterized protein At5g19025-like [Andrographis paniculata]